MKKKENILIIKHGAFGDLIQADGIFKSIRLKHKSANIVLITSNRFIYLMSKSPYIDDLLPDDRISFFHIWFYINFFKKIKRYNFSQIYDLQNSNRTYIYQKYFLSKIKWITTKRKDHKISGLMGLKDMLEENNLDTKNVLKPDIYWLSSDVDTLLKKNKITSKYILLLPGSSKNHSSKRWPYFAEFASNLIQKKYKVVIILGPEELELEQLMPGHVLKDLDWFQLAGVIEKSFFVIGNDSGPSHIASCLNKNGFALFGPSTSAKRSGLKRDNFDILKAADLNKLTINKVFKKMTEDLKKN